MAWHWQDPNWPYFTWDKNILDKAERIFAQEQGVMIGLSQHLSQEDALDISIHLMEQEAIDTSIIEGEILDRDSVRSSLRKHLGLKLDSRFPSKAAEAGIAEMMVDIYRTPKEALTHDILYRWHSMLMNGRRDIDHIGCYRQHQEPMQIVSGADYARKVHYEAPPSIRILHEMTQFITWFNQSAPDAQNALLPLARSALIHLWFEAIHPFEDGNGRIGRALSEKVLSQYQTKTMVSGIATVILRRKKAYYAALEQTNKTLDITQWVVFFASVVIEAQRRTQALVSFIIEKSKLMQKLSNNINQRQEKVLLRIFSEGIDGFQGGLSATNYAHITEAPPATVTRDLNDLVQKGALFKTGDKKSTRYHLNIILPSVAIVTTDDIL